MSLFELIKERLSQKNEESDLDNITVSATGDAFMDGDKLFDDDNESLELIERLRDAIKEFSGRSTSTPATVDSSADA